jgi:hypothetical protein
MATARGIDPFLKRRLSPLASQASQAKYSPTYSRVLPLRHGGWVPHVIQADLKQKKPNRRTRSM